MRAEFGKEYRAVGEWPDGEIWERCELPESTPEKVLAEGEAAKPADVGDLRVEWRQVSIYKGHWRPV